MKTFFCLSKGQQLLFELMLIYTLTLLPSTLMEMHLATSPEMHINFFNFQEVMLICIVLAHWAIILGPSCYMKYELTTWLEVCDHGPCRALTQKSSPFRAKVAGRAKKIRAKAQYFEPGFSCHFQVRTTFGLFSQI